MGIPSALENRRYCEDSMLISGGGILTRMRFGRPQRALNVFYALLIVIFVDFLYNKFFVSGSMSSYYAMNVLGMKFDFSDVR